MNRLLFGMGLGLTMAISASAQTPPPGPADDDKAMQACLEAAANGSGDSPSLTECIGAVSGPCLERPENGTTSGMAECMTREAGLWDQRLNAAYQKLKSDLPEDEFQELQKAQRAWLDFREAECAYQYYHWREGTIRSLYGASCQLQMTAERALTLEEYISWMALN